MLDNASWKSRWGLKPATDRGISAGPAMHAAPRAYEVRPFDAPRRKSAIRENTTTLQKLAFWILWVFAFSMPSNSLVIPGVGTLSRVVGIAAFVIGVLAVLDSGRLRTLGVGHLPMIMFVVWVSLSYFWSFAPGRTKVAIVTYLQLLVMVWLVWQFAQTFRSQLLLLRAIVLGTYVSCAATLVDYSQGTYIHYNRYAGAGFNPAELALILAITLPISLYLITRERGKMIVWLYAGQLVVAISCILLTASRGPVIACFGCFLILPFVVRQMSGGQKVLGAGLVIVACVVAFFLVPQTSWTRLSTIVGEIRSGTLNQRTMIWQAGWDVFGQSPFRGVGVSAFAPAVQHDLGMPFRDAASEIAGAENIELVAHNTFLSVLVEQGVIGFGIFMAMLLVLVHLAFRLPILERMFWLSYFATWAVGASTLTYEDRKMCWLLFGLLVAQAASQIPAIARLRRAQSKTGRRIEFGARMPISARGSQMGRWS